MRQASWFVQTRPREGVFCTWACSYCESPQPVNQRCWWSRARGSGERSRLSLGCEAG
jgi:hypothetical protein